MLCFSFTLFLNLINYIHVVDFTKFHFFKRKHSLKSQLPEKIFILVLLYLNYARNLFLFC